MIIRIPVNAGVGPESMNLTWTNALEFYSSDMLERDVNIETPGERRGGYITYWSVDENPAMGNRLELVIHVQMMNGIGNDAPDCSRVSV